MLAPSLHVIDGRPIPASPPGKTKVNMCLLVSAPDWKAPRAEHFAGPRFFSKIQDANEGQHGIMVRM